MRYKAFVSYRRSSDEAAAATLQSELQRFARRWYGAVRYRVFRDKTGATVGGALDDVIRAALRDSEFLILLASPESAAAPWVQEEVRRWCDEGRPLDRVLIAVTAGTIEWDRDAGDFVWTDTTAVPTVLSGRYEREPSYLDLRWTRDGALDENARRGLWRESAATLSATMLGVQREELIGEEIRERRKLRWAGAIVIALLTVLTALSSWLAWRAETRRRIATSRQVALQALSAARADEGLLLAVAALEITDTTEARGALLSRLETHRHLRRVMHGHSTEVASVAVLNDGTIASGGVWGAILLHDANGRQLRDFRHSSGVLLAAVPGRDMLVSGDVEGGLLLWDARSGTAKTPEGWPAGRPPGVGAATASADGASIAAGNQEGGIAVLDSARRLLLRQFAAGDREIESLAWLGTRAIVAGTTAGHVLVVNATTGAVEQRWKTGAADIALVGVVPDGTIFALDQAGRLTQWKGAESSETQLDRDVLSAAYDARRDLLAVGDSTGRISLYSRETGDTIALLAGHARAVAGLAFSPDGRLLVSGSYDETVMVWDLGQIHPIVTAWHRFDGVPEPRIRSDGSVTVLVPRENAIERWTVAAARRERVEVIPISAPAGSIGASADGRVVAWTTDGELWVHDGRSRRLASSRLPGGRAYVSASGAYVAAAASSGLEMWRLREGHHRDVPWLRQISAFAFSDDERFFAVGFTGASLRLYKTAGDDDEIAERRNVHDGFLFKIAFDPKSDRVATGGGGGDRDIVLHDLPALTSRHRLRGLHRAPISALDFSDDGRLLASAAQDQTLVLWDVEALQPIGTLTAAHESTPRNVRFAPGSDWMVSSDEQDVLIWDIRPASWKKIACAAANRELTAAEWSERIPDEDLRPLCVQ